MNLMAYKGLSRSEVDERKKIYGLNDVNASTDNILHLFYHQISSPIILLLIFACFVSFMTSDVLDGFAILVIIVVNGTIGFYQEYKSLLTLEKLKSFIPSSVKAIRDNHEKIIDKKDLVPGDIILLKLGDIVPADCLVLEHEKLLIDESALTGESNPVIKEKISTAKHPKEINTIFSGSNIKAGSVIAKVINTGERSKFGEITKLTESTKKVTAYEETIKKISEGFIWVGIIFFIIIFGAQIALGHQENLISILLFALALVITIIPEALPIVTTLALTQRAYSLAKKGVIVKRTSSIEDLGNIQVLCSDKTGTLTKNILEVCDYQQNNKDLFAYLFLSSFNSDDPFDLAIQKFLNDKNFSREDNLLIEDRPFDPELKYSERDFDKFIVRKGAPEVVLKECNLEDDRLMKKVGKLESEGYRALSFVLANEKKKIYLGTLFFIDEIKDDVEEIVAKARVNHVQIKIITGDSIEVAKHVGLKTRIIEKETQVALASDLDFDDLEKLSLQVENYTIFARTDPIQKYKIIEALQKKYHVGYIGDGINDAPSLKLANVGIVVDSATEIARSSADIILTRKDLSVLVEGILDGREAFENIDEYVKHTLTGNFGNFFTIGLLSLFINFLPMLPIQILISNLLTDIPTLALANDNVDRNQIRRPKHYDLWWILKFSLALGVISSTFDLIFFNLVKNNEPGIVQASWLFFSTLTDILIIFSIRSNKFFLKSIKPHLNLLILSFISIFISISIAFFGISSLRTDSLGISIIFTTIFVVSIYFFVSEFGKLFLLKLLHKKSIKNN